MVLAVIGGGSVFTPELVTLLAADYKAFGPMEVRLYDIDRPRLENVASFCCRLVADHPAELDIRITEDRESTLKDADYVLLQLRQGGQDARIEDELLGKKYQLPFVETISICGMATFLRTYYEYKRLVPEILKYAPNAFVLNFTNPAGQLTEALYSLGLRKVVGVCNSWMDLVKDISHYANEPEEELFMHYRGLNHLTVVDRAYNKKGEDVIPRVIAALPEDQKEFSLPTSLIRQLGVIPNHYLQYYYRRREIVNEQQQLKTVRSQDVKAINEDLLNQYRTAAELPDDLKKRGGYGYSRVVVNVIKGIECNEGSRHYAVVKNEGAISFLPEDAFIETPVFATKGGVHPICVQPLPEFIRPLISSVKGYERKAIEGAAQQDRQKLLQAMLMHPLMNDYGVAEPLLSECLDVNRDYLPEIK